MGDAYNSEHDERVARRSVAQREEGAGQRPTTPSVATLSRPDHLNANPLSLLGGSAFRGRGNQQAHIAMLQGMQQTVGNRAVQRFLRSRSVVPVQRCGGEVHAGCACANETGGAVEEEQQVQRSVSVQRHDMIEEEEEEKEATVQRSVTPLSIQRDPPPAAAATPTATATSPQPGAATQPGLTGTAAGAHTTLPANVVQEYERLRGLGGSTNLEAAFWLVVRAMEASGEIDLSIVDIQVTSGSGPAACASSQFFVYTPGHTGTYGTAYKCGCASGTATPHKVNARIAVGDISVRRIETLQSTLLHEFRHVRQHHERCNRPAGQTLVPPQSICNDCNDPDEMDSYLAQIEAATDAAALLSSWARVYVNWNYIAPEQQAIFQGRYNAALQKMNTRFPNTQWGNGTNTTITAAQTHCAAQDQAVKTRFNLAATARIYCDDPLAPLNRPVPIPPAAGTAP